MKTRFNGLNAIVAIGILGVALADRAHAGCYATEPAVPAQGPQHTGSAFPHFIRTAYVPVGDWDSNGASIVGLWKIEMLSRSTSTNTNPMPDGTLIDFGTAAWHSDGTELMNSGIRNPADGDFCQGVWSREGHSTFVLNHYALSWSGGAYTGPVNIRERVVVDPTGMHFAGTFSIVAYLASTTPGHEFDQTTPLVSITGTITGTRVTTN